MYPSPLSVSAVPGPGGTTRTLWGTTRVFSQCVELSLELSGHQHHLQVIYLLVQHSFNSLTDAVPAIRNGDDDRQG